MEFYDIPKNRYIQLELPELRKRGYHVDSPVYWVLRGTNLYFSLIPISKVPGNADVLFGPTNITKKCRVKVPLDAYSKYCICYDEEYVGIILA